MSQTRILLVEDDEKLGAQVAGQLRDAGHEVEWIRTGDRAAALDPTAYSLAVLDIMLPGAHGLDILKRFRQSSDIPVLVLSARDETRTKVRALELGADDYLTKPFWPEELLARIQARLRRPTAITDERIVVGELSVDLDARRVQLADNPLELTRVEFELLSRLAVRPGSALARGDLAEAVLDPEREGTERTLDVHISRLRKKLGPYAGCIATVWGVGYRFEPDRAP